MEFLLIGGILLIGFVATAILCTMLAIVTIGSATSEFELDLFENDEVIEKESEKRK